MNEQEFLLCGLGIYLGTCLIWLIASYIYCHIHHNEFTIKEMIGFGHAWNAADNFAIFFIPLFNTYILLLMGIISFCIFMRYIFEKIGNIKIK